MLAAVASPPLLPLNRAFRILGVSLDLATCASLSLFAIAFCAAVSAIAIAAFVLTR